MGLARRDQGARRRRCRDIGDDERHRGRPQPPSARRVAAGRHRFLCRSSSTMSQTSRRRCFANSTPSRSPQTSWYSWDETLTRIMHEFSTAVPQSSSVRCAPTARPASGRVPPTRKRVPLGLLGVLNEYACGVRPESGCPRTWRNALIVAPAALRHKNLCIIRINP